MANIFPPKRTPSSRRLGSTYFFTVSLRDRRSDLLVLCIGELHTAIRAAQARRPFRIDAWVVLPDHLHCVWTLPAGDEAFALRWRAIRNVFSRNVSPTRPVGDEAWLLAIPPSLEARRGRGSRGLWRPYTWQAVLRDKAEVEEHIAYIHHNPVRHGLVTRPADWPFSSLHRQAAMGQISLDWRHPGPDTLEVEEPLGPSHYETDPPRPFSTRQGLLPF